MKESHSTLSLASDLIIHKVPSAPKISYLGLNLPNMVIPPHFPPSTHKVGIPARVPGKSAHSHVNWARVGSAVRTPVIGQTDNYIDGPTGPARTMRRYARAHATEIWDS